MTVKHFYDEHDNLIVDRADSVNWITTPTGVTVPAMSWSKAILIIAVLIGIYILGHVLCPGLFA